MMKWIPGLVLAGLAVYAALTKGLPVVGNGKAAFWTLAIVGMAACAPGVGTAISNGGYTSLVFIVGAVLGVAALALAAAVATGMRPAFLATDTQVLVAIAVIVIAKVVIATAHGLSLAAR